MQRKNSSPELSIKRVNRLHFDSFNYSHSLRNRYPPLWHSQRLIVFTLGRRILTSRTNRLNQPTLPTLHECHTQQRPTRYLSLPIKLQQAQESLICNISLTLHLRYRLPERRIFFQSKISTENYSIWGLGFRLPWTGRMSLLRSWEILASKAFLLNILWSRLRLEQVSA